MYDMTKQFDMREIAYKDWMYLEINVLDIQLIPLKWVTL